VLVAALGCGLGRRGDEPPLRVGTSGDFPPFSVDRDGTLEGFDVEVARRLARDLGRPLELVRFTWPSLADDLTAGRFDVAMSGVTMRPDRVLLGRFTRPVAVTGAVVLTRYGVGESLKDLDRPGVRIAVNRGGHLEQVARRIFPHAGVSPVGDNRALPALLDDGAVEAILVDDAEADTLALALPNAIRVGPLTRDRKAYLARDPALAARIDAWIRAHDADGSLAALRARLLGATRAGPSTAFASDLGAVAALVDLRLGLMPAVAAAKERAGLPVRDPEQEARVLATVEARAAALGVAPDAVVRFFTVQIEVGRVLQEEYLKTPAAARPAVPTLELVGTARPAIAALSDDLVLRVAELARDAVSPDRTTPARIAEQLDASLAPSGGRLAIARALAMLFRSDSR